MQFSFLSQLPFIHSTCKTFHEDLPAQLSPIQYFLFLPFPVGCFNHRRFTKSPFFHWRTAWPSGNGITFASHIPGFFISLSTKPKSCSTEHAVRLGKLRVVGNNQRVFRLDRLLRSTWCPIFNFTAYCLKNRDSQRKPRPNCVKSTTYILKLIWCHVSAFAKGCKHVVFVYPILRAQSI